MNIQDLEPNNFDQQKPYLQALVAKASGKNLNPIELARIKAAQKTLDENGKLYNIQFILTPKAEHFLIANNEDPESFANATGNNFHCHVIQESVNILQNLVDEFYKLDDNLGNRTVLVFGLDFVLTARERSEMGYIEQAQAYNTYAYTFGKYYKQLKNKLQDKYTEQVTSNNFDRILTDERKEIEEIFNFSGTSESLIFALQKAHLNYSLLACIVKSCVELVEPQNIVCGAFGFLVFIGHSAYDEIQFEVNQAGLLLEAHMHQATSPEYAKQFMDGYFSLQDTTKTKVKTAIITWTNMSKADKIKFFEEFVITLGLIELTNKINFTTGTEFLKSLGISSFDRISTLLNLFPHALRAVVKGILRVPYPNTVYHWHPININEFEKRAAHGSFKIQL